MITAFEIERTVKTPQRYVGIFNNYAQMHLAQTVAEVLYICPEQVTPRIKKLFSQVEAMDVNDELVAAHEKIRGKIKFMTYEEWQNY